MTAGAKNWESLRSSQMSPLLPSPLGSLAAASLTEIKSMAIFSMYCKVLYFCVV